MDAIATSIPKQPTEYLATNQKREPKQKSLVLTKSATRKLASVSRPIVAKHIVTVHLPLGANGFFLSPLSVNSTAKTSCVYGTINSAASVSKVIETGSSVLGPTREHQLGDQSATKDDNALQAGRLRNSKSCALNRDGEGEHKRIDLSRGNKGEAVLTRGPSAIMAGSDPSASAEPT